MQSKHSQSLDWNWSNLRLLFKSQHFKAINLLIIQNCWLLMNLYDSEENVCILQEIRFEGHAELETRLFLF